MEEVMKVLLEMNIGQLIATGLIFWFFYTRIDGKFEKIEKRFDKIDQRFEKIDQRFEKIDQRFDKMDQELREIRSDIQGLDKRICIIETMMRMKECCLLKDNAMKKAD